MTSVSKIPDGLLEWDLPEHLAEYVTKNLFPVATRTVAELWPAQFIIVNKRRLLNTAEILAHARSMLAAAVANAVRGGRVPANAEREEVEAA